jgi:hypothetical protein
MVSYGKRPGGGTGRRTGLKIPWLNKPWGFDPPPGHQAFSGGYTCLVSAGGKFFPKVGGAFGHAGRFVPKDRPYRQQTDTNHSQKRGCRV